MKIFLFLICLILPIFLTTNQYAKELLIYADTIDYELNKTLIAKGNVKLIFILNQFNSIFIDWYNPIIRGMPIIMI